MEIYKKDKIINKNIIRNLIDFNVKIVSFNFWKYE